MIFAGSALLVLPLLYAGLMVWLRAGWLASRNQILSGDNSRELEIPDSGPNHAIIPGGEIPAFSILIAARNEATNLPQLLRDLAAQTFPAAHFEVLIADDHSTDTTAALVAAAARDSAFPLRIITLSAPQTGKKAALSAALFSTAIHRLGTGCV